MTDTTRNGLCSTCINSIRCLTWGEWKCTVYAQRFYGQNMPTECGVYKKRPKDFKETPCRCEDCLRNSAPMEDEVEIGGVG